MEFVRDSYGNVVGTALDPGVHPDTHEGAGHTHMVPVYAIPEGAHVGDLPDPVAELAAAKERIASLEANELAAARKRIAELEGGQTERDDLAAARRRIAELERDDEQAKAADPDPFGTSRL